MSSIHELRGATLLRFALLLGAAACFPTFQTARVEPGRHLDAGVIYVHDQARDGRAQRSDAIAYLDPKIGWQNVEFGLPIGVYFEEGFSGSTEAFGTSDKALLIMPWIKVGVLPPESRDHLAVIGQLSWLAPGNVGIRYGREFPTWEPHAGVSYIFSAGQAGDDPLVTRYQQDRQSLWALVAGATWRARGRPGVEIGVLRSRNFESSWPGGDRMLVVYDLFVGTRVGVGR